MSLKQELEKKKTSSQKIIWIAGGIGAVVIVYGLFSYFSTEEEIAVVAEPTEYTVKKWDITIGLESEWVIKGSNTLALGFESSGRVTSIKKNIGDPVKSWEVIATIDETSARIELQKARNSLSQAIANYSIKVKPLSALEKQQIEGSLAMNQITYENKILGFEKEITTSEKTIQDLEKKLKDYEDDLADLIGETSTTPGSTNEKEFAIQVTDAYQFIKQNLVTIDEFLGASDARRNLNDNYESLISAKNSQLKNDAEILWKELNAAQAPTIITLTQGTIDTTTKDLSKMRKLSALMIDVIDNSVSDSSNLTSATLSSLRSTFSSMYSTSSSKYTTIVNSLETDNDKRRTLDQQIAQAKVDMEYQKKQIEFKKKEIEQSRMSNEQQIANDRISYTLQLDPLSNDEKTVASLQLESARIAVQERQIALEKTKLKSPTDGIILTLDGHVGETAPSTFLTLATEWYTYVESSISEDEIELVKVGQKATITPSALPDAVFEGEVYFVSNIGDTDNNGIVTYKVYIKYTSEDTRIRTAMNVDISFISKQTKDVLIAPIKWVFAYENKPHVRMKDGSYQSVLTGLSDGKQTEIISGVKEGDVIMITN
jgi:multidrug resistance efflux pump